MSEVIPTSVPNLSAGAAGESQVKLMNSDQRFQLCVKELELIQANIARFDNNGSTIKSWCLTTWSAISAYAISEREPVVGLLGLSIILGFAVVELTYRRFQQRFILRAGEIECLLEAEKLESYHYSIDRAAANKGTNEYRTVLLLPHFTLFYIALTIFSVAVAVYCWLYPLSEHSLLLKIGGY